MLILYTILQALDILGTYLTSSAVAPLNKEYVETESPLWYVYFSYLSEDFLLTFTVRIYTLERIPGPRT